jgi:hypothetical protein
MKNSLQQLASGILSKGATITTTIVATMLPFIVSAQTTGSQILQNPTTFPNIQSFIAAFLQAIVEISLPILTLFIVYSGFMFIMARGNQTKLTAAKNNFLYVILGALLIIGAWSLALLIGSTVTQVVGNGS